MVHVLHAHVEGARNPYVGTGGPTQNSASGQISVSEKAKKCMENEKVLRLRISAEKWGPKSKFGPDNSVDNRLIFPTHPGSTSGSKNCMHQLVARARQNSGLVTPVGRYTLSTTAV